jgi:anti-sigma B factor antagonist
VTDRSTPPDLFSCDVGRNGSSAWVRPLGDLDLDTVHRVESALMELRAEGCRNLVLDLRGLTFMDSTGLRLVIRWHAAARDDGFRLAVVPGPEVVQRVFRLTGMDTQLTFAEPPPNN